MKLVLSTPLALLMLSAGCGGGDDPAADSGAADAMWSADAITLPNPDGAPPDADLSVTFDCDTIPSAPVSTTTMTGARGYHGLAITPDGDIIGSDGSSLIKSNYDNDWSVFVAGIGWGEQMDWLPDGDLVMATDNSGLARIDSTGAIIPIASDINAYGVVLGPDELIYAVISWDNSRVVAVDPDTGLYTDVVTGIDQATPHSADFSPDGKRMYIGTIGSGTVYYVDIDDNGNVIDDAKVFATNVGGGWHDAIGVDACGNIYVPDYNTSNLYKVTPSGQVSTYWVAPQFEAYPHGLVWGTGTNGWRADAMYLPQPYNGNTVIEIVVGAPSRDFQGTVLNPPPVLP
jgi:DNA-binding beta-propeller fold protein YncE